MIYGFDTEEKNEGVGALIVYAVYRSRNKQQFKISLDMWDKIERFVKSSAKRSLKIPQFIEKLKKKMLCHSLNPHWMEVGIKNDVGLFTRVNKEGVTDIIALAQQSEREFMTSVIGQSDQSAVINVLKNETAWTILLVRERLERERPQEKFINKMENND